MTTIASIAIITLVLTAYEKSDLRKTRHFSKNQICGSNDQVIVLDQPR